MSFEPPSLNMEAVNWATPGLSAGSWAEPVVKTRRRVTIWDFPGRTTVRIWAKAERLKTGSSKKKTPLIARLRCGLLRQVRPPSARRSFDDSPAGRFWRSGVGLQE